MSPLWHELIHQFPEPVGVIPLQQMDHLVDNNVLRGTEPVSSQTSRFSQIRRASVLQLPHLVFIFLTPQSSTVTPSASCHFAISGGSGLWLFSIPLEHDLFASAGVASRGNVEVNPCLIAHLNSRWACMLDDV